MVNQYEDMAGSEDDVSDHKFQSSDRTHMAGDVISLPPPTGPGRGQSIDAPAYAVGTAKDPKVLSIGMPTLKAWSDRKTK